MFPGAEMKCQRLADIVVYCPPKPILAGFVADNTPHFVHFNLVNRSTFNRNTTLAPVEIIVSDYHTIASILLSSSVTVSLAIPRVLALTRILIPLTVEKNMRERIVGSYAV
jgi:hypothetical protein